MTEVLHKKGEKAKCKIRPLRFGDVQRSRRKWIELVNRVEKRRSPSPCPKNDRLVRGGQTAVLLEDKLPDRGRGGLTGRGRGWKLRRFGIGMTLARMIGSAVPIHGGGVAQETLICAPKFRS